MKTLWSVLIAAALLSASSIVTTAGATPMGELRLPSADAASPVQNVAYVCGPFRCWQPVYSYYAPPPYVAPFVFYPYAPAWYAYRPAVYGGWYRPALYGGWWGRGW